MMNRIRVVLLIVLIASLAAGSILREETSVDESLYLGEVAPDVQFGPKGGTPPHYSSPEGVTAFNTYDIIPSIKGYAGPIKMLVALSPKGKIVGLKILEHKETPNYVHRMDKPEFLGQFLGKSVNDPLEIDRDIDGITRATVSVKALAASVREASREVASRAMGIQVVEKEAAGKFGLEWIAYGGLFAFSLALYYMTRNPRRARRLQRLRDAVLIGGIIIIGGWLSSPFSILHILNLLLLRLSSDLLLWIILVSVIVSVVIAGRFYCGWLCPFGALSEFVGRLPIRKWEIPTDADDRWRNLKYFVLGFVIVVVLVSGKTGFGNFETYVTLFSFHGTAFMWGIVVISLLASIRVRRFWCRYLCPVAAITGVLSRKDPGYVSSGDCPMSNKLMPLISECIRCNRCYHKSR